MNCRMADEMDQQLSALRELLRAHQATNECLLREQSTNSQSDTSLPSTISGQHLSIDKIVFIPRGCKCPRFYGNNDSSNVTIEDWVEEAWACTEDRNTMTEKIQFLLDHLGGEAIWKSIWK